MVWFFFSAITGAFPNLGSPCTVHTADQKTSTALTVSHNLDHLRRPPPTIQLHSLLPFRHTFVSGMVSPRSLKQPFSEAFTPSIHLLFGLPLPCYPPPLLDKSFSLTSVSHHSFNMSKPLQDYCFPSFTQASLKPTSSPNLFILHSSSPCHSAMILIWVFYRVAFLDLYFLTYTQMMLISCLITLKSSYMQMIQL